jgi:hypothetical protein
MPKLRLDERPPLNHPKGSQPPPAFWDKLSKVWLTSRALEELDRRNTQSAPTLRSRLAITERGGGEGIQTAADVLTCCSTGQLEEVKLLSRHGGPDLSGLRGVRYSILAGYSLR